MDHFDPVGDDGGSVAVESIGDENVVECNNLSPHSSTSSATTTAAAVGVAEPDQPAPLRDYRSMAPQELYPFLLQAIAQMEEKGMHGDPRYAPLVSMAGRVKTQMPFGQAQQNSPRPSYPNQQSPGYNGPPYQSGPTANPSSPPTTAMQQYGSTTATFPSSADGAGEQNQQPSHERFQSSFEHRPPPPGDQQQPPPQYGNGPPNHGHHNAAGYGSYNAVNGVAPPYPGGNFAPNPPPPPPPPMGSEFGGGIGPARSPSQNQPPPQQSWQNTAKPSPPSSGGGLTALQKQILQTHVAAYKHFSRKEYLPEPLYHAILNRRPLMPLPSQNHQNCGM